MAKRGENLVAAIDPHGKSGLADVFDLDAESFRAWVIDSIALIASSAGVDSTSIKGVATSKVGYVAGSVIPFPSSPPPPPPTPPPSTTERPPKRR